MIVSSLTFCLNNLNFSWFSVWLEHHQKVSLNEWVLNEWRRILDDCQRKIQSHWISFTPKTSAMVTHWICWEKCLNWIQRKEFLWVRHWLTAIWKNIIVLMMSLCAFHHLNLTLRTSLLLKMIWRQGYWKKLNSSTKIGCWFCLQFLALQNNYNRAKFHQPSQAKKERTKLLPKKVTICNNPYNKVVIKCVTFLLLEINFLLFPMGELSDLGWKQINLLTI